MKINNNDKILFEKVKMEGANNVRMKVLVGLGNKSENIIMRYFAISSNGNTPLHSHNYEHLVKVEEGEGVVIDKNGKEYKIKKGQSIFIEVGEQHQFKNPFSASFEFVCIIPNLDNL